MTLTVISQREMSLADDGVDNRGRFACRQRVAWWQSLHPCQGPRAWSEWDLPLPPVVGGLGWLGGWECRRVHRTVSALFSSCWQAAQPWRLHSSRARSLSLPSCERTTAFASFRSLTPSLPSPVSCTHAHLHSLSLSGFSIHGRRGRVEGISTTFQAWRGLSNSWGARVGAMDWSDNKLSHCVLLSLIPRLSLFWRLSWIMNLIIADPMERNPRSNPWAGARVFVCLFIFSIIFLTSFEWTGN